MKPTHNLTFVTFRNFWSIMKAMDAEKQRKLLMFVTGSDRIPATGATQMHLKITCGNNGDSDRYIFT
jgi:E3 ubiquitin-protein ligase HECTD2